jgi:hypothetical protein
MPKPVGEGPKIVISGLPAADATAITPPAMPIAVMPIPVTPIINLI